MQTIAPLTAEFLAAQPGSDEPWELIQGSLVRMSPAGPIHSRLALRIAARFLAFLGEDHPRLDVVADNCGFLIGRDPDTLLSPDAAIFERVAWHHRGWVEGSPVLAVEIVSPDQTLRETEAKARLYLDSGAEQVWIVEPGAGRITIHHPDGTRHLFVDEVLAGSGVLQGYSMSVGKLFADSPYRGQAE